MHWTKEKNQNSQPILQNLQALGNHGSVYNLFCIPPTASTSFQVDATNSFFLHWWILHAFNSLCFLPKNILLGMHS